VSTDISSAVPFPRGDGDTPQPDDAAVTEAFAQRLFDAALGALDLLTVELGGRLGLYAALHEHGPSTSTELAARAGIAERYAREWLEQQAVTGILAVAPAAGPADRRYELPPALVPALLEPTHPAFAAPFAGFVAPLGAVFDRLVEAYRTGTGLAWSDYPAALLEAQAASNRPAFTRDLDGWLHAIPQVDDAARRPGARILDAACGAGWSTQALARAYPGALVDGVDLDPASIALARQNLDGTDLDGRVRFDARDLAEAGGQRYDVATMFEALHDLPHPVEALAAIRTSLRPGGVLLVADEAAAEEFTAPGDAAERFFYGSSVLICLPGSLADGGVGTGAAIRPATVRRYADEAGFASCDVADVESDFFRFYVLRTNRADGPPASSAG
jgi:2-polyprenyl-3-methyl-5-hydroxy-6-metoxy-1,4-benzoquinol methylase